MHGNQANPLIPDICPHCDGVRKFSSFHLQNCPARHEVFYPTQIYPGLWVGGVETRRDPRFTAVVSILTEGEMSYFRQVEMPKCRMIHIDHADRSAGLICESGVVAKLTDAYKFVDSARASDNNHHILFHCGAGASRSTSALIGYALTRGLDNISDAFENMITKRPLAMNMWHGFVEELQALSDGLPK